ncbi:MAG: divergent polysaccharide deacetylase family protein [Pseudomonadota bacterium]
MLVLIVAAGAAWVVLTPAPVEEPTLVVELPSSPDRFATAPTAGDILPVGPEVPSETQFLPQVTEGQADTAAPQADARRTVVSEVAALETEEEELPDGTLKITIPDLETSSPGSGLTAARRALPHLVAESEYGSVPGIGRDGTTPFAAYKRRAPRTRQPQVAVMLSGLGLDPALTAAAIEKLPPEISLSFAPYSKDVSVLMATAMAAGHEVAVELPMEEPGVEAEALGPAGLTVARRGDANARRLGWLLARSPAYPMATNYLGTKFGRDADAMAEVMASLKAKGLGYIDDTGLGAEAAVNAGVPYGRVNVLIPRGSGLAEQGLMQLNGAASEGRPVLARLYVSPEAITAIEAWASKLEAQGYVLVPASAVMEGAP